MTPQLPTGDLPNDQAIFFSDSDFENDADLVLSDTPGNDLDFRPQQSPPESDDNRDHRRSCAENCVDTRKEKSTNDRFPAPQGFMKGETSSDLSDSYEDDEPIEDFEEAHINSAHIAALMTGRSNHASATVSLFHSLSKKKEKKAMKNVFKIKLKTMRRKYKSKFYIVATKRQLLKQLISEPSAS